MKKIFKKIGVFILILSILPLGGISVYASERNNQQNYVEEKIYCDATLEEDFADDRVLIMLNKEASLSFKDYQPGDFSDIGCSDIRDLTEATGKLVKNKLLTGENTSKNPAFEIDTETFRRVFCLKLKVKSKENVLRAIKKLEKREDILHAGPDYIMSICATPNDTYYGSQWAIPKIKLPNAWDTTTGSVYVTVGVLDTGIDGGHEDLAGRINTSLCRDFTSGSEVVVNPPADNNGHGTHVAGIIGACGNNDTGVAGVCWNVKLVSLKVLRDDGRGSISYTIDAINFAKAQEISILNFSGGWYNYDYYLENAIRYYSGLFICAAGNENRNNDGGNPFYPASLDLDNIISVGASNASDGRWYKQIDDASNYGAATVDIFAPGSNILSTYPASLYNSSDPDHVAQGYCLASGTSMAAPHVAGVAVLLLSANSNLTAAQLKSIIMDNVDKVSAFSTLCVSGGRLNAFNAIHALLPHTSYYYSTLNDFNHTKHCSSCSHSKTEPHTWVDYSGYAQCVYCGHIIWLLRQQ